MVTGVRISVFRTSAMFGVARASCPWTARSAARHGRDAHALFNPTGGTPVPLAQKSELRVIQTGHPDFPRGSCDPPHFFRYPQIRPLAFPAISILRVLDVPTVPYK